MATSLLKRIDRLPPFVVFALARNESGQRPNCGTMIAASGLSHRTFFRIATQLSWAKVSLREMEIFCHVCGWDVLNDCEEARQWLANRRFMEMLKPRQLRRFNLRAHLWNLSQAG